MSGRFASLAAIFSVLLLTGCGTTDVSSQRTSTSGSGDTGFASPGVSSAHTVPSAEVFAAAANTATTQIGNAPIAAPAGSPPGPRAIPRLRGPGPIVLPSLFDPIPSAGVDVSASRKPAASTLFAAGPAPRAPALSSSFVGLLDDGTVIPPDTMGAAGPNHLVSFLNSEVGFFTKTTGARLNPGVTLFGFWSPLISAGLLPAHVFDPKVIFDASIDKFIAVTLDGRLPTDNSYVLLAVSHTSDPTAGWSTWALPSDNTGATWADYPGLGVDDNNVYITVNHFDNTDDFRNSKIFYVPKPQLVILPQVTTLAWTEFTDPGFTLQPAHSFGSAPAEYLLAEANFIIGSRRFLEVLRIAGSPPALSSLGTVEVSSYPVAVLPVAPQTQVDTGDTRILNAIQRNGHLYATHTVSNATNTKTEVAWYEIIPSSPPTLAQQGRISDPACFYYYPSIAVNADGDIALGFSGSSPTEFAGGYYTARYSSDPLGTTQPVGRLKAGLAPYYKVFSTSNRWGDYSATMVDPTDDLTFWTLQEYAQTGNQWGTWWGSFVLPPPSAPTDPSGLSATPLSASAVTLAWTDTSSNEDSFVIERKTGAGSFSPIATTAANETTYPDGSLAEQTTYTYRVKARNAIGDSGYSNEASATTPASPPAGGGGGGGGGCMIPAGSGGEPPDTASLLSVGVLLLPACALGLRRVFRRREATAPLRHPLC